MMTFQFHFLRTQMCAQMSMSRSWSLGKTDAPGRQKGCIINTSVILVFMKIKVFISLGKGNSNPPASKTTTNICTVLLALLKPFENVETEAPDQFQ